MSPDKYSRTKDKEGRRIEEIDGGWFLINHAKHRAIMNEETVREQKAAHMRKKRSTVENVESSGEQLTNVSHADADADADQTPPTPRERGNAVRENGAAEKADTITQSAMNALGAIWGRSLHEWSPTEWHLWRENAFLFTPPTIAALTQFIPKQEAKYRGTLSGFLREPEKWIDRARQHYRPKRPAITVTSTLPPPPPESVRDAAHKKLAETMREAAEKIGKARA